MSEPNTPAVRFTIYPPERFDGYTVSIPRYKGGEVVNAAAYDALLASHRELYELAKRFRGEGHYTKCACKIWALADDLISNATKLIAP